VHVGRCAVDHHVTTQRAGVGTEVDAAGRPLLPSVNTVSLTRSRRPPPSPAVTSLPLTVTHGCCPAARTPPLAVSMWLSLKVARFQYGPNAVR
jgi:hypothetical protein